MTTAVIVSTTVPLNGSATFPNGPVVDPLPTLNDISASASFTIPTAENTVLAAVPGGVRAGSVYTISPNDGRVKILGGNYVRGPTAYGAAGVTAFTITETFTNTLGQSVTKNSTLTVTAVAPVVVVPGNATVADGIGRLTKSGVKIGQLPAGSSLSGTGSTHFSVDSLGQVTVNATGAAANGGAGLNASYTMTVVGGGSVTSMAFNTIANTWTATSSAEVISAATAAYVLPTLDRAIVLPTNTVLNSTIRLQNMKFSGATVDDNKNLLPQDINLIGRAPMSGGNAGASLWGPGFNGKQAFNPNATGSFSGGSLKVYCPTESGAKVDCIIWLVDCSCFHFENLNFCRMSPTDMYDSKTRAGIEVTRKAIASVTSVSATGGVLSISFDDLGAGYIPGYITEIEKLSGPGAARSFQATARINGSGQVDPTTLVIKAAGSGHDLTSKVHTYTMRIWDPPAPAGSDPNDFPGGKFYQFRSTVSTPPDQDAVVASYYPSLIFRKCRFGIGSRNDVPSSLRYNRCLSMTSVNHVIIEDCLFDGCWVCMDVNRHVRVDYRRNACRQYTNDIVDTWPIAADGIPGSNPQQRYTTLPAPFRGELNFIRTDNYTSSPNQNNLLFSNSHSDDHQHGGGGDLAKQNGFFGANIWAMHCSVIYITTQGYFDNNDNPNPKRGKAMFNFGACSTTNTYVTATTVATDGMRFERNFSTRSIYDENDLGGGLDGIGGGINLIKGPTGTIITRNCIKEVWEMDTGDGGRITSDPPTGIMTKFGTTTPRNRGPIYISDNFYISYLTPNTGNGDSWPEVFKGYNAAGQGPAFIWNGALGISGPGAGKPSIGYHRWWEFVRDTPATNSWADTWAAVARGKADIQSIFTPLAGSGADGRHPFPAENW